MPDFHSVASNAPKTLCLISYQVGLVTALSMYLS
jgi:hypothetical protein